MLLSPTLRKEMVGSASSPLDGPAVTPKQSLALGGWGEERTFALTQTDHPPSGAPQPRPRWDPLPAAGGEDGVWEKGRLPRKVQLCVQVQGLGWDVLGVSRGYSTAALWLRA